MQPPADRQPICGSLSTRRVSTRSSPRFVKPPSGSMRPVRKRGHKDSQRGLVTQQCSGLGAARRSDSKACVFSSSYRIGGRAHSAVCGRAVSLVRARVWFDSQPVWGRFGVDRGRFGECPVSIRGRSGDHSGSIRSGFLAAFGLICRPNSGRSGVDFRPNVGGRVSGELKMCLLSSSSLPTDRTPSSLICHQGLFDLAWHSSSTVPPKFGNAQFAD